jgi:hypothetical protein
MRFTKRLNTPNIYANPIKLRQAIKTFVDDANKECASIMTYKVAFELITKSRTTKAKLYPNQKAVVKAREKRKNIREKTGPKDSQIQSKAKNLNKAFVCIEI